MLLIVTIIIESYYIFRRIAFQFLQLVMHWDFHFQGHAILRALWTSGAPTERGFWPWQKLAWPETNFSMEWAIVILPRLIQWLYDTEWLKDIFLRWVYWILMTPEMLQEATVLQCISMFVGHSRYPILFGHFVCTSVHILSLMSAAYILFFFRVKVRAFAHKGHVSAGRFQVFGIKTFFFGVDILIFRIFRSWKANFLLHGMGIEPTRPTCDPPKKVSVKV